jgi:hypothetical protein
VTEKIKYGIVSMTPGYTPPTYEPLLGKGDKLNHRQQMQKTVDGYVFIDNKLVPGATFNIGLGRFVGIESTQLIDPHTHETDEVVFLISTRPDGKLGAEVEMKIDGDTHTFTHTTAIFVPKGVKHGPIIHRNFYGDQRHYTMHILPRGDYH